MVARVILQKLWTLEAKKLEIDFFSIERIGNKKFNFRICISDGTPQLMELESNFTKLDFEGTPDTHALVKVFFYPFAMTFGTSQRYSPLDHSNPADVN